MDSLVPCDSLTYKACIKCNKQSCSCELAVVDKYNFRAYFKEASGGNDGPKLVVQMWGTAGYTFFGRGGADFAKKPGNSLKELLREASLYVRLV